MRNIIISRPYDQAVKEASKLNIDMFNVSSILAICYDADKEAILNDLVTLRKNRRG